MKITNLSAVKTLYLRDLKFVREAQTNGGRGEDRYLAPGASVYLPNTTEVIRSAKTGELYAWAHSSPPLVALEDTEILAANGNPGDTVVLTHNLGLPPVVSVLKFVGPTGWVDATGTYDMHHDTSFMATTITNTTNAPLLLYIRLL